MQIIFFIQIGAVEQWIQSGALLKFKNILNGLYKLDGIVIPDYGIKSNLVKIDIDKNKGITVDGLNIQLTLNVTFKYQYPIIREIPYLGRGFRIRWIGSFDTDETAQLFYMNEIGEL